MNLNNEALREFDKAIELNSDYKDALVEKILLNEQFENYELATDALTHVIPLASSNNEKNKLENACNILVREAKKNGGYDNISVILIFND